MAPPAPPAMVIVSETELKVLRRLAAEADTLVNGCSVKMTSLKTRSEQDFSAALAGVQWELKNLKSLQDAAGNSARASVSKPSRGGASHT